MMAASEKHWDDLMWSTIKNLVTWLGLSTIDCRLVVRTTCHPDEGGVQSAECASFTRFSITRVPRRPDEAIQQINFEKNQQSLSVVAIMYHDDILSSCVI